MKPKFRLTLMLFLGAWLAAGCSALVRQPSATAELALATPLADSPAAGICAQAEGSTPTMTINPDVPDPRCLVVRPEQRLRVVNGRDETLVVTLGRLTATIEPGDEHTFEATFGQLLQPGVHHLEVTPCCGGELWLQEGPQE